MKNRINFNVSTIFNYGKTHRNIKTVTKVNNLKIRFLRKGRIYEQKKLLSFVELFVRNGQFLPAPPSPCRKYPSAICGGHSFAETVFVASFTGRRLVCSFHDFFKMSGKDNFFFNTNDFSFSIIPKGNPFNHTFATLF